MDMKPASDVKKSSKRADYISWDEYFMGVAMLASMRSKDPNTHVQRCRRGLPPIPGNRKNYPD